ncbi:hypothetical protein CHUAL_009772 [Chamberlinius hualienensis]
MCLLMLIPSRGFKSLYTKMILSSLLFYSCCLVDRVSVVGGGWSSLASPGPVGHYSNHNHQPLSCWTVWKSNTQSRKFIFNFSTPYWQVMGNYCLYLFFLWTLMSTAVLSAPSKINKRVGNVQIVYHVGDIVEHAYTPNQPVTSSSAASTSTTEAVTTTAPSTTSTKMPSTTMSTKVPNSEIPTAKIVQIVTSVNDEWSVEQQRVIRHQLEEQQRLERQQQRQQQRQLSKLTEQQKEFEIQHQQQSQSRQQQEQETQNMSHQQHIEKQKQVEQQQKQLERQFEQQSNKTDVGESSRYKYLVHGNNLKKFRVEENNSDGQITGLFGFQQNNGAFRGVQYSADTGSLPPKVLYDTILRFFSL